MELIGLLLAVGLGVAAWSAATQAQARVRALEHEVARLHGILARLREGTSGAAPGALEAAPTPAGPPAPEPAQASPAAAAPVSAASAPGPPAPPRVIVHPQPAFEKSDTVQRRRAPGRGFGRADLEARLGARLPVWLGATALVLAVVYLVKYSFDQNLLSPLARVVIGVVFGVGLVAAAEPLRGRSGRVAEGVCAAGVGALFASFLAATNLYGLLSAGAGFVALALTTAAGVVLSLRHGPIVAAIGLVGGFATPALIEAREPSAVVLFGYLLLLESGLLAVARRRGWQGLAVLTVGAALVWPALWTFESDAGEGRIVVGLFLLATAAAFVFAARPAAREGAPPREASLRDLWAPVVVLALLGLRLGRADFSALEWGFVGLLSAGALALARLDPVYDRLAALAAAFCAALVFAWIEAASGGRPDPRRFGPVVLLLGALHAGGAWLAHDRAARPARFVALSVASAVVFTTLAKLGLPPPRVPHAFGAIALVLAAAYAVAARTAFLSRDRAPEGESVLAALCVGVAALVSLAFAFELERATLTVALAALVPALAFADPALRVPALRAVATLLGVVVGLRLLTNTAVLDYPASRHALLHWVPFGYGLPAAAFALAAERFRATGALRLADGLLAGAIAFGSFGAALEVRQLFHDGRLGGGWTSLAEWGTYAVVGLACGLALALAAERWPRRPLASGGAVVLGLALGYAVSVLGVAENPLWSHHDVGARPVWNVLLLAYGLPAALAAAAVPAARREGRSRLALATGGTALLLVFWHATLSVRHAFHGGVLVGGGTTLAELYAYSIAWIVLGIALLVLGLRLGSAPLRAASLVVMLLAVVKVFAYDTRHLRDLYRVFSFLGLGVSLLVLAFLYQRFVSPRGAREDG